MPQSIPIPRITLGKRKERSQMCEILTDDGRWIDQELPALYSCVDWEDKGISFLLDSNNQYLAEDDNWHQLLSEKTQVPLCFRQTSIYQDGKDDEKDLKAVSGQLFKLTREDAKAQQFKKAKENEVWNRVVWAISIVCGTMLAIAAMQHFWG